MDPALCEGIKEKCYHRVTESMQKEDTPDPDEKFWWSKPIKILYRPHAWHNKSRFGIAQDDFWSNLNVYKFKSNAINDRVTISFVLIPASCFLKTFENELATKLWLLLRKEKIRNNFH